MLDHTPDPTRSSELAQALAEAHLPNQQHSYYFTRDIPEGAPVFASDQFSVTLRDNPNAVLIVVEPIDKD